MSDYRIETNDKQAIDTSAAIEKAAQRLEEALADAQQKMAAVEGRSEAGFIHTFKADFDELNSKGVAEAAGTIKTQSAQLKQTAILQAAEAQKNIEI